MPEQCNGQRRLFGLEIGCGKVVLDGVVGGIRAGAELQRFRKSGKGTDRVTVLEPTDAQKIPRLAGGNTGLERLLETAGRPGEIILLEIGHAGLKVF